MTTGDALLAAIQANPDDDLVRLVYADYLEENGDPDRAELIRVQIELTHLPPDAPNWLDTDGRRKLLLAANRTRWLGDRLKVAPNPAWVFRRGFPDELDFSRERISYWDFQALAASPQLAEVTSLVLRASGIGSAGVAALANSPFVSQIRSLELGENWLQESDVTALAASPFLTSLVDLNLNGTDIGDDGAVALAESTSLARLTRLSLRNCRIRERGVSALANSEALPQLRTLHLGRNAIGDAGAEGVADSPQAVRLTALDLEYANLSDDGAIALARSPHLAGLTELSLRGNYGIGVAGAEALIARFGDIVGRAVTEIVDTRRGWDEDRVRREEEAIAERRRRVQEALARLGVQGP